MSKLPSSSNNNKEKFQKCILLLFKPFHVLADLYNGYSWDESYQATDFGENSRYIENIEEMHLGLQEREDDCDNDDANANDDDMLDDLDDELQDESSILQEVEIDTQTQQAVDIVKQTGWLEESTSTQLIMEPAFESSHSLPRINQWKKDIKKTKLGHFR